MAVGQLSHAAFHLGRALFHDPALESAYSALGDVAEAAGSSDAARELFKGDGNTVFPGNAAAIIALIAGEGRVSEAVELLGSVVAAHPEKPWAVAPWFTPESARSLPLISIGRAVTAVWQAVDNPAPPETARALAPWLVLARTAAGRPDIDADCLCAFSALARRLGAYQDSIAWCGTAEELETRSKGRATQPTLIMLGYAHRDAGQLEQAIDAWTRAAALRPTNADLLLDLADITFDQGDVEQSLSWAERAAAIDGTAVKHRAAVLAARYRAGRQARGGGDIAQLTQLVDLAVAHPRVPYLRNCVSRACEGATWLQTVPPPTEAVCQSFGYLAEIEESGQGKVARVSSYATSLEAPTPMTIHRACFPQSSVAVSHIPEPDPRIPVRTEFGPPLWFYRGTEASATVATPSPEAVELVQQVAKGIWADPLVAFDRAAAFTRLDSADLLGLLAHMPPPREPSWMEVQRRYPLYWQRFAQVWVCVGILHHRPEEPWPRSTRRTLLLRLLFGPDDWTVDAAAFALCVAAWRYPQQRAEIADTIAQRYLHAAQAVGKRPTQLHDPLARVVLICPKIDPKVARLAQKNLAARQESVAVDDRTKPTDSLLRKWTRRKDR
ncbi:tetratricopeptide repeat protein [Streptomyces sp. NPDC001984]|uniref:tetratricopeptide repeat protein n=1 Tax=Streptomyces sp. NPDC002619 TaxID=3364655 RepID=UPI00369C7D65